VSEQSILEGRGIVAGCALGKVVTIAGPAHDTFRLSLSSEQVAPEIDRLRQAIAGTSADLAKIHDEVSRKSGADLGAIFDAQRLILGDPQLQASLEGEIRDHRVNAEWAVREVVAGLIAEFRQLEVTHLRERADDLRDVARSLLRTLSGDLSEAVSRLSTNEPLVLLAHDLTPSEAIRLSRAGVVGFGVEVGGETSHTAIIARSLDLPLVSGLPEGLEDLPETAQAIIDGDRGRVILDPSPETLDAHLVQVEESTARTARLVETAALDAVTRDGLEIALMANIDLPDELPDVSRFHAAGIGLYRSEFLFIERSPDLPSEDEQVQLLCNVLAASSPHPAIVRTFDLGGRKLAQEVIETHEDNPVLGLRGVRLTLRRPDIFKSQVRAILRAGTFGRLRVLLPMVTAVEEIEDFRSFVAECAEELEREGVPHQLNFRLGAMVEVPSAAIIADRLAQHVDFMSLGTNDLVQYSLAVDRSNEHVAYLYQPFHPAILRMVRFVVDAASKADVALVVCGEIAADPRATPILLGLGLRRLSVTPRAIPGLKQRICSLDSAGLGSVADRCLEADSVSQVKTIMREAGWLDAPQAE